MSTNVGVRPAGPRRRYLLSLAVMGAVVCVLGGTGLFAALTDSARTGNNNLNTGALAGAADIQIATAVAAPPPTGTGGPGITCDLTWAEELTTGGFSANSIASGYTTGNRYYCLRNVGSQTVGLAVTIDSLFDIDLACTGDESLYDDTTCGNQDTGELAEVLTVTYTLPQCADIALPHPIATIGMAENVNQPPVLMGFQIPAGGTICVGVKADYPTTTAIDEVQRAQSDSVLWRFKFTATAQSS